MQPDDWERVRDVRLRALTDAPDAFGTTLDQDLARPLAQWRTRLEDSSAATFVAMVAGRDIGLVIGRKYGTDDVSAGLFGMWVAAEMRGRGIGCALVDCVIAWARAARYQRILLDVADDNAPAIRLYKSRGFVRNGVTGTLPAPRQHLREHQRALAL